MICKCFVTIAEFLFYIAYAGYLLRYNVTVNNVTARKEIRDAPEEEKLCRDFSLSWKRPNPLAFTVVVLLGIVENRVCCCDCPGDV